MSSAYLKSESDAAVEAYGFESAQEYFDEFVEKLRSEATAGMTESQLSSFIASETVELNRRLFESTIRQRCADEPAERPEAADGVARTQRRRRGRTLESDFGRISFGRAGYAAPGHDSLFVADAWLNLGVGQLGIYSLSVRRKVAKLVARLSFNATSDVLADMSSAHVPKRQLEELAFAASVDFDAFYERRAFERMAEGGSVPLAAADDLLVLSFDSKGVPMIPSGLREGTYQRAIEAKPRERGDRLEPGQKKDRKRMAQVAAVYFSRPIERSAEDILSGAYKRAKPKFKRVFASLRKPPKETMRAGFEEALSRDPDRSRRWVVLVDGCRHQLGRVKALAREFEVDVLILLDIVHVVEGLWKAARALEGSYDAQKRWVGERLLRVLRGQARGVARGMKQSATKRKLSKRKRKPVDACAKYLSNNAGIADYNAAFDLGAPIATGVIEGACRHLVGERMGISGANWSLDIGEAVLRLRALVQNDDFDEYWSFHEQREYERNHVQRYADGDIPSPTSPRETTSARQYGHLSVIK